MSSVHAIARRLGAGLALLPLAAGSVPAQDDVDAVLARVRSAYGGTEALAAFAGFEARGRILSLADGISGRVRMHVAVGGDLRTEITYPERTEIRILAGPLAWSGGRRNQEPASRDMLTSMKLQFHRLVAPFELADAAPEDFAGKGTSAEGWTRLGRDWGGNLRTIYDVDQEGLVRRVTGEMGTGDDQLSFETESHDFRDVAGMPFPFRMTTIVAGHPAAETILDRVEPRTSFEPDTFLPRGAAGDM
jgi:hypothetical protein